MKKTMIFLIVLSFISIGILSGCEQSSEKTENKNPTAYISAEPISGYAPLTVSFRGSGTDSDGHITSYNWDFGDGSSSGNQNQSHSYSSPGTYIATLTVTDNRGATGTIPRTITVQTPEEPPSSITLNDGTVVEGDFQYFEFTDFEHERVIDEENLDNTYLFIRGNIKNIEDRTLDTVKITIRYYNLYYGYLTSVDKYFHYILPGTTFLFYDYIYGTHEQQDGGGSSWPTHESLVIEVS